MVNSGGYQLSNKQNILIPISFLVWSKVFCWPSFWMENAPVITEVISLMQQNFILTETHSMRAAIKFFFEVSSRIAFHRPLAYYKGNYFQSMELLKWLILQRKYLVWISYSYCLFLSITIHHLLSDFKQVNI